MTKPAWAVSPATWEMAKKNVRKQYGINSGARFKELSEAQYIVLGGAINRTALIRKSVETIRAGSFFMTKDGRILMTKAEQHFVSEAQRKFLWAKHPDVARAWAHGQHTGQGKVRRKPGVRGLGVHSKAAGTTSETKEGRKKLRVEKKKKQER